MPRGPKPQTLSAWAWMDAHRDALLTRVRTESTQAIADSLSAQGLPVSIHAVRAWFRRFPAFHEANRAKKRAAGKLGGYPTHKPRESADYDRLACRRVTPDAAMLDRLMTRLTPEARATRIVMGGEWEDLS